MRVMVVGAGVVGLTCAVRLLEAGHRVDVVARDLPRETTSVVAAALWYPYRALPQDRVTAWAARAYTVFAELAAAEADSGVRMLTGTEVMASTTDDPWWRPAVPSLNRVSRLPEGYADGWSFVSPVVSMPAYLDWLAARVLELGGTLTRLTLSALPGGADVVVNCSGMGARLLARRRVSGSGAGTGGRRRAVRPRILVAGRRRTDVRGAAARRGRRRRHGRGG